MHHDCDRAGKARRSGVSRRSYSRWRRPYTAWTAAARHCLGRGGARVEERSAEGQRMHHGCAKVGRRMRQGIRAKGVITVGSFKAPAYPTGWQVIVGFELVCVLSVTSALEPTAWTAAARHRMGCGGARVKERRAVGQRMHHGGAKVGRRMGQGIRAMGVIAVGSFKAPAYPTNRQAIVGFGLVCFLSVTSALEPYLHNARGSRMTPRRSPT